MEHCWDCGSPLRDVLLLIAISVALVAFSFSALAKSSFERLAVFSWCSAASGTSSPPEASSGSASPGLQIRSIAMQSQILLRYFAWYGITAVVVVGVCRAARKSARAVAYLRAGADFGPPRW